MSFSDGFVLGLSAVFRNGFGSVAPEHQQITRFDIRFNQPCASEILQAELPTLQTLFKAKTVEIDKGYAVVRVEGEDVDGVDICQKLAQQYGRSVTYKDNVFTIDPE